MYIYMCVCVCVYVYLGSIFSFKHVWLNKTNTLCLLILYLIHLSLCMRCLTFEWNKFRETSYASQVLLAPTGAIFGKVNNEMINKMMHCIHLYKQEEKKQMGGEFAEDKNFTSGKRKNWQEMCERQFRIWLLYSNLILFKKGLSLSGELQELRVFVCFIFV